MHPHVFIHGCQATGQIYSTIQKPLEYIDFPNLIFIKCIVYTEETGFKGFVFFWLITIAYCFHFFFFASQIEILNYQLEWINVMISFMLNLCTLLIIIAFINTYWLPCAKFGKFIENCVCVCVEFAHVFNGWCGIYSMWGPQPSVIGNLQNYFACNRNSVGKNYNGLSGMEC